MPIYQFVCTKCVHNLEEMLSVNAPRPRKCPACGELSLQQQIGIPAVHMRYSLAHPRHMRGQRRAK